MSAPSIPTAAPSLRVAGVLVGASRIWRRELRSLTLLAAVLELPLVIAEIALHVTPGLKSLAEESFTLTAGFLLVGIYGSLSHQFLAGLLEKVVGADRRAHRRPTRGEILHDLPWRRLIVADLLLTAMVAIGLVLFVVPGLIVLTWFAVTLPIVNLERNTVRASFLRSYRLVRGHSWRVGTVAMCAFVVPEIAIGACAWVTHLATDDVTINAIAHAIPAIALMPIAALPIVVLAYELVDLDAEHREVDVSP